MKAHVVRIPMAGPDDVSGLRALFDRGELLPKEVVAVLAKTEGNGCVNDFSRGYAIFAFQALLSEALGISRADVAQRVAFVMSGGTEGVMSPHATIFARGPARRSVNGAKRLAIGIARTPDFSPEEIGRMPQVRAVAAAVHEAMRDAEIAAAGDVHFVQIKCPLLTSDRIEDARRRGKVPVTADTYESMGYSRGASALGVAVAMGEVRAEALSDPVICHDWTLYSTVASTSAGSELTNCEIILMGNAAASASDLIIGHAVMRDAIDGEAVREALANAGLAPGDGGARVINVFAKAEAAPSGHIRGRRHTMLNDSDINSTRHARAAVAAVIASIVGDPMVYISGGAEHQGPSGGGPVAVIART